MQCRALVQDVSIQALFKLKPKFTNFYSMHCYNQLLSDYNNIDGAGEATLYRLTSQGFSFTMVALAGIPMDAAAIMSSVLEGILYGMYRNESSRP